LVQVILEKLGVPSEIRGATSSKPISNFTPRAQQVLALARKEADRFNHNFVGTEHVLLGIIRLGQGVAVNVLQKLGLDLEAVRREIEKHIGTGPDEKMFGNIPFTPRVKKVLVLTQKEARTLNDTYIGTQHILLGLLREGDGVAARVLINFDVDIERARQEILKELDSNLFIARGNEIVPSVSALKDSADNLTLQENGWFYSNFTPRALQVLALARREADRFNHSFVGTEHLLLGLINLGQGVAASILEKLGLNLETVRMEIEKQVGAGPDQKIPGNIPYTPHMKKVLALAQKEAKALHHTYVGTEHILLGLLREGEGVAARVFENLNVNVKQARKEILKELNPNFIPGEND
jgi:ATP-dependent Clp protease ATP-binding subunit ClpA